MERAATRDPERTRRSLLEAAFAEMYENGFQAASLERILAKTAVTKGALYHHFANKQALGLAVIDELIAAHFREQIARPLETTDDPLPVLREQARARATQCTSEELALGCPLNNLIQEMAPLDADFREHLAAILQSWRAAIADALRRGQQAGRVRADVDADEAAAFITASLEGAQGMVKASRSLDLLQGCLNQLDRYLASLAAG